MVVRDTNPRTMTFYLLLVAAGFGAGIMNAIAGGGSFLTFPVLVFGGVPSIVANASSTVALFPGAFTAAWAYRADFKPIHGVSLKSMLISSIAGGIAGALLLLYTPQRTFDVIIPWILLFATLVFLFGERLTRAARHLFRIRPVPFISAHFVMGIYAGYFGGALGLITLAMCSLFGLTDLKAMNPSKILIGGCTNAAAVVCFLAAGKVWWLQTTLMLAGAVVGGYVGALVGRRVEARRIRTVVTIVSVAVTIGFFIRR